MDIWASGTGLLLDAFTKAITPRTKVLAFTYTSTAGDFLPAREPCRIARERGVLTLVDGAQTFGLLDVDLADGCRGRAQPRGHHAVSEDCRLTGVRTVRVERVSIQFDGKSSGFPDVNVDGFISQTAADNFSKDPGFSGLSSCYPRRTDS